MDHHAEIPTKFFNRPRVWQTWRDKAIRGEKHLKASWSELFFDLVFVAAASKLGVMLRQNICAEGFWEYVVCFWILFGFWKSTTALITRVSADDFVSMWLIFLEMVGVVGMNLQIPIHSVQNWSLEGRQYWTYGAIIARASLAILFFRVALYNPEARRQFALLVGISIIHLIVLAVSTYITDVNDMVTTWASLIALDLFFLSTAGLYWKDHVIPMNVEHMSERAGIFVIVFLGESVIAAGIKVPEKENLLGAYGNSVLALLIAFVNKLIYFDLHRSEGRHALQWTLLSGKTWFLAHFWICGALICLGSGLELMVSHGHLANMEEQHLLGFASAAVMFGNLVLSLCNRGRGRRFRRIPKHIRAGFRAICTIALVVLTNVDVDMLKDWFLLIIAAVILFDFFIEYYGRLRKDYRVQIQMGDHEALMEKQQNTNPGFFDPDSEDDSSSQSSGSTSGMNICEILRAAEAALQESERKTEELRQEVYRLRDEKQIGCCKAI